MFRYRRCSLIFIVVSLVANAARVAELADASDGILSADAIEVCGPPDQMDLMELDKPCLKGRHVPCLKGQTKPCKLLGAGDEPESLKPATVTLGQKDGPYRLPANRLYVCNPNSELRGMVFKEGQAPQRITTNKELTHVAEELFGNRLFELENEYPGGVVTRTSGKVLSGSQQRVEQRHLWNLDVDGNLIVAPETQHGILHKHGDLTPGELPWKRPSVGEARSPEAEKRWTGRYRGMSRCAGELHFRPGQRPLLQDESSYSSYRILPDTIEKENPKGLPINKLVYSGKRSPTLSTCTMRRLKLYLKGRVGLSLNNVDVAAVFFVNKKRHYKHV